MSDSEDPEEVLFPCPVCGEELAELDDMWRQIHINGCLTRDQPAMLQRCQTDKCPICGTRLNHISAQMATKHINECMDRERRQRAPSRPQERCPFCGQSLRDLSDRQRQLHDQTCRKTSAVQEADVVHYPKVVESLPTPAEWEIVQEVRPVFVNNEPMVPEDIPVFGVLMRLGDLQSLTGFQFTNHPIPASIEDLDIDSETEL